MAFYDPPSSNVLPPFFLVLGIPNPDELEKVTITLNVRLARLGAIRSQLFCFFSAWLISDV